MSLNAGTTQTGDPYGIQSWNGGEARGNGERAGGEGLHISNSGDVHNVPDEPEGAWLHWPTLAAYVGPGFLVCIAYLDPGNLEADLQVGTTIKQAGEAEAGAGSIFCAYLTFGLCALLRPCVAS